MALRNLVAEYPGLRALVRDGDGEVLDTYLSTNNEVFARWCKDKIVKRELGGRAFQVLIDRPVDDNPGHYVVTASEYAGGFYAPDGKTLHHSVIAGKMLRDLVAPGAALVHLPNNGYRQPNLQLNYKERMRLLRGDESPLVDRMRAVTEGAESVMTYGASQAATTTLAFAAHPDVPTIAAGVVSIPTVLRRSPLQLATSFSGSAGNMHDNLRLMVPHTDHETSYVDDYRRSFTAKNGARYLRAMVDADNVAASGILRREAFVDTATRVLDKGSAMAHIWATHDTVSPDNENSRASEALSHSAVNGYMSLRLQGECADHSIVALFPVGVLAVRMALLRNMTR